jgi:hypothetical protein
MVHFRLHPGYVRAVSTPEDFELGIPCTFEGLMRGDGLDDGPKDPAGVWIAVRGGGLPVPVVVRIDQTRDGRFMVTGLLIGLDERREVTWTTLRQIKPATILSNIFAGWDPRIPEKALSEALERPDFSWDEPTIEEFADPNLPLNLARPDPPGPDEIEQAAKWSREWPRALRAYELWRQTRPDERASPAEEVTRARASVATNLTEFAGAYRRNYAVNPRRATTATAEELHISRATAIRRIAECRDIGLLAAQDHES